MGTFIGASALLRLLVLLQVLLLVTTAGDIPVAVAIFGKCNTMCRVFSLHCLSVCRPSFLPHRSCLSASSALHRVSPTPSPSRASSAALLAARQTMRLPLALRMLDPSSIQIHDALSITLCACSAHPHLHALNLCFLLLLSRQSIPLEFFLSLSLSFSLFVPALS